MPCETAYIVGQTSAPRNALERWGGYGIVVACLLLWLVVDTAGIHIGVIRYRQVVMALRTLLVSISHPLANDRPLLS